MMQNDRSFPSLSVYNNVISARLCMGVLVTFRLGENRRRGKPSSADEMHGAREEDRKQYQACRSGALSAGAIISH